MGSAVAATGSREEGTPRSTGQMRLAVLGSGPACQNPGGACSGYLLEQGETSVLLDCGSGVFGRLQQHRTPDAVQAIVISHTHADHTLDLLQYRYFLFFTAQEGRAPARPALFLPPGGHQRLLELSGLQDPSPTFFSDHFEVQEYDPARALHIGPLSLDFLPVRHIPHTYGIRARGSARFAFSADSGPCPALAELARGSDLFLCECANPQGSDYPLHLTARQAGEVAADAEVRQLLLTHRWVGYGEESAVAEAREIYAGPIAMAREGTSVPIHP